MNENIIQAIATELKVQLSQVENTLSLLAEGNTVPFIARYRKEATKGLDEEQIFYIQKQYEYQQKLAERKENVLKLIEEQGKLTEEIKQSVIECTKLSQVEDIYRPYAQKKKTRATTAIKNGLQPLADWMLALPTEGSLEVEAEKYLSETVTSVADAIQGAKDIIAEVVSDNAKQRWAFKDTIMQAGVLQTKLKKDAVDENKVYEMYYDRSEKISQLADHRIMAIDRAEKEKVITVSFVFDDEQLKKNALKTLLKGQTTIVEETLNEAVIDGCDRLLFPSIEREIRSELSERAQNKSIEIFSMNLEKLLLQAPLKGRIVLGFDPGFFNGCKLAVIDETGKMLTVSKIFPFSKKGEDIETSKKKLLALIQKYHVQIIAIGNGTASRESEKLVAELIHEQKLDVSYAIVSEAGASVWSAQEAARKEFPDIEVEERSAVSIGRRLLDPLAELIKIDPQSIGVGQYQHDLPQKALAERLDEVVLKSVNRTGADLNTASLELLTHISGLNSGTAQEIVNYRNENGRFTNRKQLLKVKKLGPKAFTQCAGFLRITDGDEPLDQTSIHPESYEAARKLMQACGITKLGEADISFPKEKTAELGIDEYTLKDIEEAIRQPLRDYREQFDGALLKSDVLNISDLHVGDQLSGTVRNVVDFGAFVDIGLHEDGLVHLSHMSMKRISHPSECVAVNDIVKVWVYQIDETRNRVQLSLLPLDQLEQRDAAYRHRKAAVGKHNNQRPKQNKPIKKEVSMDDALARLKERFGK
ncbi:Tex family protein [Solobacterium sp.]|uniref:Tex family protein n=1 Tax=Solobacterium sp. TaxID=2060878 RepID=UPI001CB5ED19|nr:Tex family protein [Solobacterium sp.]MBF1095631.1 RNA-binding transcriptional accessory protein [Solobacterium sp.]MBF1100028.1 RNA-binding transcriptional accessory protein [Solobacterium sp.]